MATNGQRLIQKIIRKWDSRKKEEGLTPDQEWREYCHFMDSELAPIAVEQRRIEKQSEVDAARIVIT